MIEKINNISEESIKKLVDGFYDKVRQNEDLAYIFENKIGKIKEDWQPHLQNMYDFWYSLMVSSGKYRGNPMKKHKDLPAFPEDKFDKWLELFSKTAAELFEEDIAKKFTEKSQLIARSLKYGLYQCG
jgi:hemoglobin